ncbi:hypothetical protein ABIB40_002948 [Pedobacter sp. UYP30]|uniref:hypothetical protein n=1 Tax=Pedobacter sp. UYP30 TaxID=1756400 RepID=UPI003399925B
MEDSLNNCDPSFFQINIFFDQKGFDLKDAKAFYDEYSGRGWRGRRGITVKNWRAKALDWMWRLQKDRPYLRAKEKLMFK